jgi:hypothetical protein
LFRLAKELGHSVEWIINNISTAEIRGWVEYFTYIAEAEREAANKRGRP